MNKLANWNIAQSQLKSEHVNHMLKSQFL